MKGGRNTCDSKIANATRRNVAHSGYLLSAAGIPKQTVQISMAAAEMADWAATIAMTTWETEVTTAEAATREP